MKDKRIVIIDDCRLTLSVASDILSKEGFTVDTAESSLSANPMIFSNSPPDLILVDVEMPLFDGEKTVRHLRSRPRSKNISVVMISAKPEAELSAISKAAGADGYVCKPLAPEVLLSKVKSLILSRVSSGI